MLFLYFPTAWDDESEIVAMYEILQLILTNIRQSGARIVIGGGFNANVGSFHVLTKQTSWDNGVQACGMLEVLHWSARLFVWVANCKSTIVSQQCG